MQIRLGSIRILWERVTRFRLRVRNVSCIRKLISRKKIRYSCHVMVRQTHLHLAAVTYFLRNFIFVTLVKIIQVFFIWGKIDLCWLMPQTWYVHKITQRTVNLKLRIAKLVHHPPGFFSLLRRCWLRPHVLIVPLSVWLNEWKSDFGQQVKHYSRVNTVNHTKN